MYPPLHPNCRCQLLPNAYAAYPIEQSDDDAWYTPLLRIPADAQNMAELFILAQQERLHRGTLDGYLDWLTSGSCSGLYNRFETFWNNPSLYNLINYITLGAADVVKGAVAPDEPLSLEHWLNSLCVVSIAVGIYKAGTRSYHVPKNTKQLIQIAKHAERIASKYPDAFIKELKPQILLDELSHSGVKYTQEDVIMVTKTPAGKLMWLERGNETAGLTHIIKTHGTDFANKGILQNQIPDYIMTALDSGRIIEYQGRGTGRPIYEFTYHDVVQQVAVTTGSNGFIVGANPVSIK